MFGKGKLISVALLIGVFLAVESKAIDDPFSRKTRANVIYLGAGIPSLINAGYRRQIFPTISLDLRVITMIISINGGGIGLKYYPAKSNHSFVAGVYQNILFFPDFFDYNPPGYWLSVTSMSIGYDYLSRGGFNFFLDVGPSVVYNFSMDYGEKYGWLPYANIGVGYAF